MDGNAQAKAFAPSAVRPVLRVRTPIDLAEGNQPPRHVEDTDLIRYCLEEHKDRLAVLDTSYS
jgi:hypothetical protein